MKSIAVNFALSSRPRLQGGREQQQQRARIRTCNAAKIRASLGENDACSLSADQSRGVSRRQLIGAGSAVLLFSATPSQARTTRAIEGSIETTQGQNLTLTDLENSIRLAQFHAPLRARRSDDILYPSWLRGRWNVRSTLLAVRAPQGPKRFIGGGAGYARALSQLSDRPTIEYAARFVPSSTATVNNGAFADREFNLAKIAQAELGSQSVMEASARDANHARLELTVPGGSLFRAELEVTARTSGFLENKHDEQVAVFNDRFLACEQCVQTVRALRNDGGLANARARKTITETISIFEIEDDVPSKSAPSPASNVMSLQQIAIYRHPYDPLYSPAFVEPVDVRVYRVHYARN